MPRRYARRDRGRDDNELSWEEEQELSARYGNDRESEDIGSAHGCRDRDQDCDCDRDCRRFDADDEKDRFFFRSNGSTTWDQRRWSSAKQVDCCKHK